MSILPEQPESLLDEKRNTKKVTDPSVLLSITKSMVNKVKVADNPDHRSKEMISRWRVANLLNAVDETTWHNMVSAALDGQRKNLLNIQSNGDWQPCELEVEIREDRGEAFLMLGVRWTDERGEDDVQYHNGAPIVNVNVTAKSDPQNNEATLELLKLLAAGQLSANDAIARLKSGAKSSEPIAAIAAIPSKDDIVIKEPAAKEPIKKANPRTARKRSLKRPPAN